MLSHPKMGLLVCFKKQNNTLILKNNNKKKYKENRKQLTGFSANHSPGKRQQWASASEAKSISRSTVHSAQCYACQEPAEPAHILTEGKAAAKRGQHFSPPHIQGRLCSRQDAEVRVGRAACSQPAWTQVNPEELKHAPHTHKIELSLIPSRGIAELNPLLFFRCSHSLEMTLAFGDNRTLWKANSFKLSLLVSNTQSTRCPCFSVWVNKPSLLLPRYAAKSLLQLSQGIPKREFQQSSKQPRLNQD